MPTTTASTADDRIHNTLDDLGWLVTSWQGPRIDLLRTLERIHTRASILAHMVADDQLDLLQIAHMAAEYWHVDHPSE